jgi:hypothetical protein
MRKETLKALKALSRKELPLPPPKVVRDKKIYNRHSKHRAGHRDDSGPFYLSGLRSI